MFDEVHTDGEVIFTRVEQCFSIRKLESISSIEGKNCILIGRRRGWVEEEEECNSDEIAGSWSEFD